MKSKKAELEVAPRYEEYHLEKLRRRYLFRQLWGMSSVRESIQWDAVIGDEEIEPHPRRRRDVVVDLLRDEMILPPDMIVTRGPRAYHIGERCVAGIEEVQIEAGWSLDLGTSPVVRSWQDIPPSKDLWAAAGALAEGLGHLYLETDGSNHRLSVRVDMPTVESGTNEDEAAPVPAGNFDGA